MNTKHWTVLFVAMLSFDYAAATYYFGNYRAPKSYAKENEGYYGWSKSCHCNDRVTKSLDGALEKVKEHLGKDKGNCKLKDHHLEEYEFRDGQLRGLHRFKRTGPYRCSVSREHVRIIFVVEFIELLVHYTVCFVKDILKHFLGGIVSPIGHIFGKITHFLFRIILSEVYVTVVLLQRFDSNQELQLEGLYMNNIEKISFKDQKFRQREDSLGPYFKPLCDHVVRNVFKEEVGKVFTEQFRHVRVKKEHFYYKSYSGGYEIYDDDRSDHSKASSRSHEHDHSGKDHSKESKKSHKHDHSGKDHSKESKKSHKHDHSGKDHSKESKKSHKHDHSGKDHSKESKKSHKHDHSGKDHSKESKKSHKQDHSGKDHSKESKKSHKHDHSGKDHSKESSKSHKHDHSGKDHSKESSRYHEHDHSGKDHSKESSRSYEHDHSGSEHSEESTKYRYYSDDNSDEDSAKENFD